tara:strand:- start:113 stop:514 length:402 start_codon:yes stop_codon:yes gene_type:complete
MFIKRRDKKGANILTENIIFLVLNLIFLTIVVLFVFSKSGSGALLEEQYAKQIALTIDSAKARMSIDLDLKEGIKKAEKEGQTVENMISINKNVVTVKIDPKGKGYSYSFFNDVDVSIKYVGGTFYRIEVKNG